LSEARIEQTPGPRPRRNALQPGQAYVVEFEVIDRAGPYWFHPHPHGQTAHQVYMGLAGLFIVGDEEEAAVGLPTGEFDVPLVVQDRAFDADNQFVYPTASTGMMNHSMSGMADASTPGSGGMMGGDGMQMMMGVLGSQMLVNGKADFSLPVATRAYTLRLWNGSNARIYKLRWSTGEPIVVIGSDGGLLDKPVTPPAPLRAAVRCSNRRYEQPPIFDSRSALGLSEEMDRPGGQKYFLIPYSAISDSQNPK